MLELFTQSLIFFGCYLVADFIFARLAFKNRFFVRVIVGFPIFGALALAYLILAQQRSLPEILTCGLLFYLLWALYTIVLVSVGNSFSLGLLQVFLKKPGHQMKPSEMAPLFGLPTSLEYRLTSLKKSALIQEDSTGRLFIAPKGRYLVRGTLLLRTLLRLTDVG